MREILKCLVFNTASCVFGFYSLHLFANHQTQEQHRNELQKIKDTYDRSGK
jgi:hypothetical protein